MGRVYAVASGKGGVGKTTTTVNLGAALAAAGHEVAVVDADLGMANVAGAFGVEPSAATVHDVLAGEASAADATYEGAGGVRVIPGSADVTAFARSDPEGLDDLLDALSEYDFVLLDTGASLTHVTVRPLAIADEVLLVSTTERAALGDTDRTREVTDRVGGSVVGAVLTRVDPANPNAEEVTATLDAKVLEVVPEDPSVSESMAAGEPLELRAPQSQAAAAYRRLAALLSGDADADGESAGDESDADAEPEARSRPADADATRAAVGESSVGESDDVSDAVESVVGDSDTPADAAARADEADDPVPEGESADRSEPEGIAAPTEPAAADARGAAGLSDALASAETGAESDVPDADTADDDPHDDDVEDEGPSAGDADAAETDRDGNVEEAHADRATVEETDAGEAEENTVSETVLADEFARGLVEEAEPGDADGSRADEAGTRGDRSAGGAAGVPDAESAAGDGSEEDVEDEDEDEDEDGDGRGFFRRLLG